MEIKEESEMIGPISEYEESQGRFHSLTKKKEYVNSINGSDDKVNYLDIIRKLCNKDEDLDIGHDSTLFYELIIYSDFIQIKDELVKPFYSELLNKSIQNNILDDIVGNLERLEVVPHLKKFFVEQLFIIFQLSPIVRNDSLILDYSKDKVQYDVNLGNINSITMLPRAYKFILSNEEFDISCLNFLIRICNVKKLILSGCNLNGRNVHALFHGLKLESLNLSECGTCVNKIIQDNISGILDNLKELDISRNPLLNQTLESLRWVPLNYLNISNCIKSSGKFFNSIWFSDYFASQMDIEGEDGKGNMNILWEDGVLRETIKILNASCNDLTKTNLQLILQSQLIELDIRRSLKLNSVDLTDVAFPKSLKSLRAQLNDFLFKDFKVLCGTCIEKLEMDYYEKYGNDYSDLYDSSLTKTLTDLSICVSESSEQLIRFISNFKLKFFRCVGTYDYSENSQVILGYISKHNSTKHCLEALEIGGPNLEVRNNNEFFTNFRKLYLKELSLHSGEFGAEIKQFLCCENLHESIESLKLEDSYMISDDDLIEIAKFKRIVKLCFSFNHKISYCNLKKVVEMDTLKELIVSATIDGTLTIDLAHLLSIAPIQMLRICRGGNVTDEAFQYLTDAKDCVFYSDQLVSLLSISCNFVPNMAKILKKIDWEEMMLIDCTWQDDSADIILTNERLIWSLNHFSTSIHINNYWKPEHFQKLLLSYLKTGKSEFNENLPGLKAVPISKFLYSLCVSRHQRKEDLEYLQEMLKTNISIVDIYGWDPRAIIMANNLFGNFQFNMLWNYEV